MENQGTAPVMSVKDWVVTLIISALPVIGIIMLFVWAFGSGNNPNKANWAKGALVLAAIVLVLYILFFLIFGAAMLGSMGGMEGM